MTGRRRGGGLVPERDLRLRDSPVLPPVGSPTTDPSNVNSLSIGWIGLPWSPGGRKRQLAIEDAYWQLIMDGGWHGRGLPPGGITCTTGSRWRAEGDGLPPLRVAESERGESGTCRWLSGCGAPRTASSPVYARRGLEFTASRRAPLRFSAGPSALVRLGAPREHPSREATAR